MKKKTRDNLIVSALLVMVNEPDQAKRQEIRREIEGLLFEWKDLRAKEVRKRLGMVDP